MDMLFNMMVPKTNYSIMNVNNIYNYILSVIEMIPEKEEAVIKKHLRLIRFNIGNQFYDNFLNYVRKKDTTNIILKL